MELQTATGPGPASLGDEARRICQDPLVARRVGRIHAQQPLARWSSRSPASRGASRSSTPRCAGSAN